MGTDMDTENPVRSIVVKVTLLIYLSTILFLKVTNTNASLRALEWIVDDSDPMIVDRKNFFVHVFMS